MTKGEAMAAAGEDGLIRLPSWPRGDGLTVRGGKLWQGDYEANLHRSIEHVTYWEVGRTMEQIREDAIVEAAKVIFRETIGQESRWWKEAEGDYREIARRVIEAYEREMGEG